MFFLFFFFKLVIKRAPVDCSWPLWPLNPASWPLQRQQPQQAALKPCHLITSPVWCSAALCRFIDTLCGPPHPKARHHTDNCGTSAHKNTQRLQIFPDGTEHQTAPVHCSVATSSLVKTEFEVHLNLFYLCPFHPICSLTQLESCLLGLSIFTWNWRAPWKRCLVKWFKTKCMHATKKSSTAQ